MIVIDVGCARYGGDYSIEHLIETFYPDMLYGFDPNWPENEPNVIHSLLHPTTTFVERSAAWIYDGEVHFMADGLNSQIGEHESWPLVPCIDLARFIEKLPTDEIVLKIDAEGSEYVLLPHLIEVGIDKLLKLAWIEWHPGLAADAVEKRSQIEKEIRCPLEEWHW